MAAGLWFLGSTLSRPARARLGDAPQDLHAENVRLSLASGGFVAGWFARADAHRGAVLLLHSVRANRGSMVERARFLRHAGYSVLLIDLPAHGESSGDHITFGVRESEGTRAALAFLRRAAPGERIGALGSSLGGASLLLGAGHPAANDSDAVVLEAVYPTIGEAVADRLRIRLGALGPPLTPLFTMQLRPRLGIDAADLRPIDRITALHVPLLVIAGEADRHTMLTESKRLFESAPQPKTLWIVPGAAHGDLYASAGAEYEHTVLAFFDRYLRAEER